jgi:DNA end-binding protein Ku
MISVPVKLTAAARSSNISFNMLHKTDNARIRQKVVCSVEEVEVDRKDLVKGYEVEEGRYVIIEESDLEKIKPPSSKTMEVLEFVSLDDVDPVYFDTSYYIVPEQAGEKPYYLLAKALENSAYVGIARLTMHQRENVVFIRPSLGGLMLHTIYYANEVRQADDFGRSDKVAISDKELEMARMLVDAMATEFEPTKYEDSYQTRMKAMIEAKIEGRKVADAVEAPAPSPVVDLMAALKASIAAASKDTPAPAHATRDDGDSHHAAAGGRRRAPVASRRPEPT